MKRIFILGVCALFIACNSSSEKTSETDSSTVSVVDTTAAVSTTDTASTVETVPAEAAAVTQPASPETKPAEAAPAKPPVVKEEAPAKPAVEADNGDAKKGESLIAKSDCFACHKVQDKVLGPSYKDVANKYEKTKANIDYLANKIKTGGSGVWGAVPMSPHPALSDDDAKAMVAYILSLK
jgi:cytochrome c